MYQRCLVNGQLFHSQTYQKVTQRNSYSVIYMSADNCNQEYSFGEVLYYGSFTDSNLGTMHSYAFVSPFQLIIKDLVKDDTTGLQVEGLYLFRRNR